VRARTGRGEFSKSNHYSPLRYIFIDSYVYHKLILLIPQIIIMRSPGNTIQFLNYGYSHLYCYG